MRKLCRVVLWASALTAVFTAAQGRSITSAEDPLTRIESDFNAGVISYDERALFIVAAIRHPESLPAKYAVAVQAGETVVAPGRDATLALLEIKKNWDRLSPTVQQSVAQALTRWATAFTYDTPGGFFKVHYDITGTRAVPPADASGNGIPDYVDKCTAYLDSTAAKNVSLGYLMPPSDGGMGGDNRYDVYFEAMSYYGYAQPEAEGPQPWSDATSYLVLHNTFLGFPPNSDPEGDQYGAMKATIAHEFRHSVQFSYDYTEYGWFMELDATYTEDVVFPLTRDNFNYLNAYFVSPAMSLMTENASHEYSSFIWGKYLDQRFERSLMRAVWEGARYGASVHTALSDTLLSRYGWTQDSAFAEFASWNFATGSRNDGLHHTDAASYPLIAIGATHTSYPVPLQSSPSSPGGYAASYVRFQPVATPGALRIMFDGSDSRQWAAWVIKSTAANVHQFQRITLAPGTYTGQTDILNFQSYTSVTLVGVNLSEFSAAATFQYSAVIPSIYSVSSDILTDTMVYSGATRQFDYEITNNAPVDDVVKVTASDTQGWINIAPFDRFIPAGQSSVVTIPVTAPVKTPLGSHSTLLFKATSRNDTTAFDTQAQSATTVLQRGDVDFDGQLDISDLTTLIAFLYLSGPPPEPVEESGNFDCQDGIDIADLTGFINYLYLSGELSPCRAF